MIVVLVIELLIEFISHSWTNSTINWLV